MTTKRSLRFAAPAWVLVALFLVLCPIQAMAEIPDTFTNLKVFPQDIGKRQLLGAMRDFSTSLGVRCTFCHVQREPGEFDSIDWASDELESQGGGPGNDDDDPQHQQRTAAGGGRRGRGPGALHHLPSGAGGPPDPERRSCSTPSRRTVWRSASPGIASCASEYYGSGSYDFSPMVLTGAGRNPWPRVKATWTAPCRSWIWVWR